MHTAIYSRISADQTGEGLGVAGYRGHAGIVGARVLGGGAEAEAANLQSVLRVGESRRRGNLTYRTIVGH